MLFPSSTNVSELFFQLHNWTFFHNFHKADCRKKLAFFHFTFFPRKKRFNFSSFWFFNTKQVFTQILCTTFFPGKKRFFFHGFEIEYNKTGIY